MTAGSRRGRSVAQTSTSPQTLLNPTVYLRSPPDAQNLQSQVTLVDTIPGSRSLYPLRPQGERRRSFPSLWRFFPNFRRFLSSDDTRPPSHFPGEATLSPSSPYALQPLRSSLPSTPNPTNPTPDPLSITSTSRAPIPTHSSDITDNRTNTLAGPSIETLDTLESEVDLPTDPGVQSKAQEHENESHLHSPPPPPILSS